MKFRAVMEDAEYMREFLNIIVTLSKLTKECVINIEKDKVHFIANEESGTTAPLVWVDIDAKLYFPEYHLELPDKHHSQIMLSVSPANLSRAFSSLRSNARHCKLKLLNLQFPCLRVEVDVLTQNSNQIRNTSHDVPVTVIPRSDWDFYELPQKPNCKLVLNVPSNRLMRGLIDKIKNLSPTVIFYATSGGEMNLVAETELATITTRYKNLDIKELNPSEDERHKQQIEASCSVDCKKTSIFFSALQVPTGELACGIDDDRLIHLEVNIRHGIAIHSILPAVCM
ncbi:checkpoint protein HUS1 isoform X2 [Stomoxys calcitrans]|nr:checkpoint protein HUS1 isoform X2 [Stomoxys calcitrans]XP_013112034.1 checkpoint protein HUS1 isoform X2 [Stomoxys calcitrans]